MEELKPRIRPKAPASLKQNVLREAKRIDLTTQAGGGLMGGRFQEAGLLKWVAAAAVLLVGIMTFALHGVDKNNKVEPLLVSTIPPPSHQKEETAGEHHSNKEEVATGGLQGSVAGKQGSMAAGGPLLLGGGVRGGGEIKGAPPSPSQEEGTTHVASAEPSQALQAEELTPYERQLLANFEAHRDLVNARLAEELAQVRFMQQRLGLSTQQYLQQYRELQQRITEQIRQDIDNIAPKEQSAEEV